MRLRRVIISSLCAIAVVFGLFLWLVLWYDDIMPQDKDYPPSFVENAFSWVCVLALWPFWITELILGHDPENRIYWLLLWIATGIFGGLIIELFFIVRGRKTPNQSAAANSRRAFRLRVAGDLEARRALHRRSPAAVAELGR